MSKYKKLSKEKLLEIVEQLEEELKDPKKYGLFWDKEKVVEKVVADCENNLPVLKRIKSKEIKTDDSEDNILIEGDNYHALNVLNYTHKGEIDVIYIDPPYNTGNNDFIYNDHFVDKEDGYRHSMWLNFMEKRLKASKRLLADKGVIFISIDDNEFAQLKLLCDNIFGETNFISMLSIENNPKGRKNSDFISTSNEYCLIYAKDKNKSYFVENIPKPASDLTTDENGVYIHNSGKRVLVGENKFNPIVTDFNSNKHYSVYYNKVENKLITRKEKTINDIDEDLLNDGYKRYYSYFKNKFVLNTYTESKILELFKNNALDFKNGKIYEKNFNTKIRLKSLVINRQYEAIINNKKKDYKIDVKTTSAGTELKNIFGTDKIPFNNPKNTGLLKLLITLLEDDSVTVLDFMAGSGTTGHAVLDLNNEDGGNRKFILCTNNESNICTDVCYPRLTKVIKGYKNNKGENVKGLGGNLQYFKTDFVKNTTNRDQLKINLTKKCTEVLCVKENIFNLQKEKDNYKIFTSNDKKRHLCIYYNFIEKDFDNFVKDVAKLDGKKAVYIFALDNKIDRDKFKGIKDISFEAIPYKILEVYEQLVKISKK